MEGFSFQRSASVFIEVLQLKLHHASSLDSRLNGRLVTALLSSSLMFDVPCSAQSLEYSMQHKALLRHWQAHSRFVDIDHGR